MIARRRIVRLAFPATQVADLVRVVFKGRHVVQRFHRLRNRVHTQRQVNQLQRIIRHKADGLAVAHAVLREALRLADAVRRVLLFHLRRAHRPAVVGKLDPDHHQRAARALVVFNSVRVDQFVAAAQRDAVQIRRYAQRQQIVEGAACHVGDDAIFDRLAVIRQRRDVGLLRRGQLDLQRDLRRAIFDLLLREFLRQVRGHAVHPSVQIGCRVALGLLQRLAVKGRGHLRMVP